MSLGQDGTKDETSDVEDQSPTPRPAREGTTSAAGGAEQDLEGTTSASILHYGESKESSGSNGAPEIASPRGRRGRPWGPMLPRAVPAGTAAPTTYGSMLTAAEQPAVHEDRTTRSPGQAPRGSHDLFSNGSGLRSRAVTREGLGSPATPEE